MTDDRLISEYFGDGNWAWPLDAVREKPWDTVSQLGTHVAAAAAGVFVAVLILQTPSMAYCADSSPLVGVGGYCQELGSLATRMQKSAGIGVAVGVGAAVIGDYQSTD
jgi:hypothetical protein